MARVNRPGLKAFTSFLVGLVTGGMIGIMSLTVLISYRLDQFYEEIAELKSVIEEKDDRLNKLEESTNKQRFILKEIKIELTFEGDEMDEIELKKHIRNKYITLIGKQVKSIDIDLLEEVIDHRIMELGKNRYQLFIRKIILTDILVIWVNVESIK
jgi:septal ring factor EnvC (AmiA/AmiB activator)